MANVLSDLMEDLAGRVGGMDIAKELYEQIRKEGGSRSLHQRKIRNLINSYNVTDAVIDAKEANIDFPDTSNKTKLNFSGNKDIDEKLGVPIPNKEHEAEIHREAQARLEREQIEQAYVDAYNAKYGDQPKTAAQQEQKQKEYADKEKELIEAFEMQDQLKEAQEKIDKQNKPLPLRTLGTLSEAGKSVVFNAKDFFFGKNRKENAAFATEYNDILYKNDSTDFIDIHGAKKLRSEFEGKTAQEIFDAQQQGVKMGGTGKKGKPNNISTNGDSGTNPKDKDTANDILDFHPLKELGNFIREDSANTMAVAGIGIGTGLIGAELLDEN